MHIGLFCFRANGDVIRPSLVKQIILSSWTLRSSLILTPSIQRDGCAPQPRASHCNVIWLISQKEAESVLECSKIRNAFKCILLLTASCSLAYAEIYLAFATLIRQFEFELYDTSEKNITFTRDFGTPYPDEGNFSLKVLVKSLVQE